MSRHPLRRNALATSIAMALAAWPAVTPHAASCVWGAPATGNWATAGNWSCGIVPGASDDATPSTAALQVSAGHNITNTGGLISIGTGQHRPTDPLRRHAHGSKAGC